MLLLVGVAACSESILLDGLGDRESIEIVVALNRAGINAQRELTGSGHSAHYKVFVAQADYVRALEAVHDLGYPREESRELDQWMETKSFVPVSRELASARLDHLLALELERVIESVPGVVEARIVVRSNLGIAGTRQVSGPSASLVVRYFATSQFNDESVSKLNKIVQQSIPGLSADAIEIVLEKIDFSGVLESGSDIGAQGGSGLKALSPFTFRVPAAERGTALRQLSGYIAVGIGAGFILGLLTGYIFTLRRSKTRELGAKSRSNTDMTGTQLAQVKKASLLSGKRND